MTFFVPGRAAPGGSKRAFRNRTTGRIAVVEAAKGNAAWRVDVRAEAEAALLAAVSPGQSALIYPGEYDPVCACLRCRLWREPLDLYVTFAVARPRGHYGMSGELRPRYRAALPTTRPDLTKLLRALEDALTGIVWRDDAQVVLQWVTKGYAVNGRIGAHVIVAPIADRATDRPTEEASK